MQRPDDPDVAHPHDTQARRRTALIVMAVIAFVVLAGTLHLAGVLPPGS